MQKAIEIKGEDYFYPVDEDACLYAIDGKPSCIVGYAINILDPDAFANLASVEEEYGTENAESLTDAPLGGKVRYLPGDFWDDDAAYFASVVQSNQDRGIQWGLALAYGEDRA